MDDVGSRVAFHGARSHGRGHVVANHEQLTVQDRDPVLFTRAQPSVARLWPGVVRVAWPERSPRPCAAFLAITSATAPGRRAISTASGASAAMAGKGARAAA